MGGFCPGGFCPGRFCPRGDFVRGILSGGFCPGGFCPRTVKTEEVVLCSVIEHGYDAISFPNCTKELGLRLVLLYCSLKTQ